MRSVRCDDCGTKALMAASQCPKCGHPFAVRDGFGDLLPLSHCSTCNSDYPASIGSCKWCGTMPERAPIGSRVWKGIGIVAFVGMAWGAWMVHDDKPATTAKASRLQDLLKPESTALSPDSARALQTLASANDLDTSGGAANAIDTNAIDTADTMVRDIPMSIVATDSTLLPMLAGFATQDSIVSVQSAGTIAEPESTVTADSAPEAVPVAREAVREPVRPPTRAPARAAVAREPVRAPVRAAPTTTRDVVRAPAAARAPTRPAPKPPARATARAEVRPPAKAAPRVAAAPKASARSSKPGRWTTTVARSWVVVRADPNRRSRIIASIGPNTRVQLGEARGGWRRVKAKGLQGWVEHRSFVARAPLAKKARLAAR
jgi:hypothetical protein